MVIYYQIYTHPKKHLLLFIKSSQRRQCRLLWTHCRIVFKYGDELGYIYKAIKKAISKYSDDVAKGVGKAEIGRKLEYVFGKATESKHNIERSLDMERQLNKIGIFDNAKGRSIVQEHLEAAFENTTNGTLQKNGRMLKESLLFGPNDSVKVQSIWEGNKLINVEIFGGMK